MPAILRLLLIVMLSAGAATVHAAEWTVSRVTGQAWIQTPDGGQVGMAAGMTIPKGATAQTGAKGRAILTDGSSSMVLAPRTLVAVPYKPERGLNTTVLQQIGSVEFEVEKRGRPHFSVHTPVLAAVVKGTRFTVAVTVRTADIEVERGLVGVTDLKTGENADVTAGQAAGIGADGKFHVSGSASEPTIKAGKPRAALLGPAVASSPDGTANAGSVGTTAGASGSTGTAGVAAEVSGGVTAGVDVTGVADVGASVKTGGVGVGANVAGGTVGVGASVRSGGVGVGTSVGGTVGGGVSVGGGSSGGSSGTSRGSSSDRGSIGGSLGGSLGGTAGSVTNSLGL